MNARMFRGDAAIDRFPDDNRLVYGDGLFETLRVIGGIAPWWDAHWSRLALGARRLRLSLPDEGQAQDVVRELFGDRADGVLKLLLVRGGEGRGYAPDTDAAPLWRLSRHPLPARRTSGLRMHWCQTPAAIQPMLAGLKHCNRLDQVLARAECVAAQTDEGLMCDGDGAVIGATAGNVFVRRDAAWCTPPVDRAGVAGICRAQLLPLLGAREVRLSRDQVETADAVFICNAVRGILPVTRLGTRTWPEPSPVLGAARLLAHSHPGMAFDLEPS
jgi:4-amino-4-deoxychorismate lyase